MNRAGWAHNIRGFLGLLAAMLAIYVVFLAFLVLIQRDLMYFPDATPFRPESYGLKGFQRLAYQAADGTDVHGFYAPPTRAGRPVIMFFQGNAGHLGQRADKIKAWRSWGYGVMLPTYRGYHGNKGTPDEEGLYSDARAGLKALMERMKIARKNIVFYGESLGSGIAVQMAEEGPERGLVLEVPYTSVTDIGSHRYPFVPIMWLAYDRFESLAKIRKIHAPLLVLKAGRDTVIPSVLAQKLFEAANQPKTLVTHPAADHMEIYTSPDVVSAIRSFLDGL